MNDGLASRAGAAIRWRAHVAGVEAIYFVRLLVLATMLAPDAWAVGHREHCFGYVYARYRRRWCSNRMPPMNSMMSPIEVLASIRVAGLTRGPKFGELTSIHPPTAAVASRGGAWRTDTRPGWTPAGRVRRLLRKHDE